MTCLEVVGGSSSSHGHTDTDTAAFSPVPTSSQGHTAHAVPGAKFVSKLSVGNFVPSLLWKTTEREREKTNRNKKEKSQH